MSKIIKFIYEVCFVVVVSVFILFLITDVYSGIVNGEQFGLKSLTSKIYFDKTPIIFIFVFIFKVGIVVGSISVAYSHITIFITKIKNKLITTNKNSNKITSKFRRLRKTKKTHIKKAHKKRKRKN